MAQRIWSSLRRLLASCALLVGACAFNQDHPYPESWPPLPAVKTEGCLDLGGTYADRGESENFPSVNPRQRMSLPREKITP
jgi:hypothetical protein